MTKNETATGWIVFDRVEIDLAGRRLFVAGAEAPLEPKAFDVLALLARHPGQAFTRDQRKRHREQVAVHKRRFVGSQFLAKYDPLPE